MMNTLESWIKYFKSNHVKQIDLSLERTRIIAERLDLIPYPIPAIVVAGTNGKGSTVACLEQIYCQAGYKVGSYTSPELLHFNERIKVNRVPVSDDEIAKSFAKIATHLDELSLTYFEAATLAALDTLVQQDCELVILEVGMGGRYDAVNVVDAEIAVITSIDLDHQQFLGNTREKIAYEKAGVLRCNQAGVIGEIDVPSTLVNYAEQIAAKLYFIQKEFAFHNNHKHWDWCNQNKKLTDLPKPKIYLTNAACALQVVDLLQSKFSVDETIIRQALSQVCIPGRLQVIQNQPEILCDVAHNPASIKVLVNYLQENPLKGRNLAVFSMLNDKDLVSSIALTKDWMTAWFIAPVDDARSVTEIDLQTAMQKNKIFNYKSYKNIFMAFDAARETASAKDRIIVFGSFVTVASVLQQIKLSNVSIG